MTLILARRPLHMVLDQPVGWFKGKEQLTLWLIFLRITILF